MKKIIAFLAILMVLTTGVFATGNEVAKETHSIRLKSPVSEILPAFQLTLTSGAVTIVTTNPNKATYDVKNNFSVVAEVADISQKDLNLVFTASLASVAKQNASYLLSFEAGPFKVTRGGEAGTLDANKDTSCVLVGTLPDGVVDGESTDGKTYATVKFNGTTTTTGNLVTFTCGYTADKTIDPLPTGYFADITMTITTTN